MSGYFLLGLLRNLGRNKLHSLINLASLSIGLAVFAFALLYVKQELSYDRGIANAEHILRLRLSQKGLPGSPDGEFDGVNARTFPALIQNFPDQIDHATRMYSSQVNPAELDTPKYWNLAIVDPAFADIFKLAVQSGSLKAALAAPGFIAVEESVAAAYPQTLKVGDRIKLKSGAFAMVKGKREVAPDVEYQVAAIFRMPKNVSFAVNFQLITLMDGYAAQMYPMGGNAKSAPWELSNHIWLTLKPGVNLDHFNAQMPDFIDSVVTAYNANLKAGDHISTHLSYRFQPVSDLHFHPLGREQGGDIGRVLTIAVIGVLVLLVGCSNAVSLSLASVMERRREIGIHKTVGALQKDILLQYLGESVLMALLAVVPALLLVEWLLPPFLTLLNIRQAPQPVLMDYLVLPLIAALVGLASGLYPALVLSAVKPEQVLKVNNAGGMRGNQSIRTALVGFQFCFALMLIIATLALYVQLQVVRAQPLGFNGDNLLYLIGSNSGTQGSEGNALIKELSKLSDVVGVTSAGMPPNSNMPLDVNSLTLAAKDKEVTEIHAQAFYGDPDFINVMKIPVLAGRIFDVVMDARDLSTGKYKNQPAEEKPENRLVLNRSAAKALGFTNPQAAVDQFIFQRTSDNGGAIHEMPTRILGVVEDNLYGSLRRKPGPEAYGLANYFGSNIMLKFDETSKDTIQQEVKRVWQQVTGTPLQYITFIQTQLESAYLVEKNESRLLLYCAGLALFLSCIGLYGLAAFTMERRTKEVGVRKVMGASVSAITVLFMWRYARPVLLATLIASPIAVYFVLQWMERFPYQMDKLWLLPLCLAAGTVVLVIALLTVAGIVLKAARARPVQSLRYE